ncbi:MAG: DUF4330 domain-containing protein [Clostridium sp.]|nr:DUF4330 domain-containing protein [Clostridium sp.]
MSLKELKTFDYILIIAIVAVLGIGLLVYLGKNKFNKTPVEATKKIAFQVMLKSVSVTDNEMPFKIGDEAFITIRNVPYTKLKIIDSLYQTKKTMVPTNDPKQPFIVTEDYSQPYQYDFIVTLVDEAKITKDGPVVGGNKIKIGLPIVLEGFNYRVGGTISNVQIINNKDLEAINKYVNEALKNQETKKTNQAEETVKKEADTEQSEKK